jgi:hypothetical protein
MPIYFAARDLNQHQRMLHYLTPAYISKHCAGQECLIDTLYNCYRTHLLWDIVSLDASFAVAYKYRRYIYWDVIARRDNLNWKPYEFKRVKKYLLPYKHMLNARYFTDDFFVAVPELIDWLRVKYLPPDIINDIIEHVPLCWAIINRCLSVAFVVHNEQHIDWRQLSRMSSIPLDIVRQYKHCLNWYDVVRNTQLSDDLIMYVMQKIPVSYIAAYQQIGRDLIIRYSNLWPMEVISATQKLSATVIFELASILHAKHLAVNIWTSSAVLYSGAGIYYLIVRPEEIEQLKSTIVHSQPLSARKTADGCELRIAQCMS